MTDLNLHMDVRWKRGDFALDVNIMVQDGITALFGRSGAGKTTLVLLIAGLLTPHEGLIRIGDTVLFDSSKNINVPPHLRNVGYVFQEARLFPHLSVQQNLTYGMSRMAPTLQAESFAHVVALLDIENILQRRIKNLSGGEKQRVAIGRALLSNPKILLMDEPLANLDGTHKSEILPYLEHLCEAFSIPVIYVSHAIEEVVRLTDTLVLIDGGRIAAQGPVEDIMGRLDLSPLTGRYESGAVLNATVKGHDDSVKLTRLDLCGHTLFTPQIDVPIGRTVRLRPRARDVAISLQPPENTSILNQIPVTVSDVRCDGGPHVELSLTICPSADFNITKTQNILARITRKSFEELKLDRGTYAHALIKAVAIDRHSLGGIGKPQKP